MATPNAGYAVLQVIPSVRGISDELRRQIVGPAGDAGDRAGTAAGEGLKSKLKAGAVVAGIAAGAALVKGIGDAMGQLNATSLLQAQLGSTNKVAAKHGKIAGRLYSTGVTDTFEDAAASIRVVMTSGLLPPGATNKQIESISAKVTDLSTVFDADLGQAANAAGQLMKTGLARNATEAIDLITRGFQTMGPRADDLIDTTNEYAGQFQKLGLSGKEAFGLLSQGMKAGARDTDFVADALKEFSIRAVDGSKASAEGFKALGLNAREMTAQIAGGGKGASDGLQLVLDRLRAMKDPVEREAAAVALFGTKAEDLGKSLFALDPSKAEQALGRVEDASKKVGETIRSGPAHELTVFKRTLQQAFVEFLGGKVLPVITEVGRWLNTYLVPALAATADVVGPVLVAGFSGLVQVGRSVVDWLRDMNAWLIPIGIAVAGFTLALSANAIAIGLVTVAMRVAGGVAKVWTAITRAATIAHAALNAVMRANVIILVITAIVALVAALVVAYKKSETFRNIVNGAFQGMLAVGRAIGGWFSGPFVRFFTQTIPGAFRTVLNWVRSNWPWLLGALTGPIGLAVVFIVKHWRRVRDFFLAAWQFIVRNVLTPIRTFFTSTIPGWARTVRDRVVAAWGTVRDRVHSAYAFVRDGVFSPLRTFFTSTIPGWAATVRDRVAGAFGTLRDRVHGVYTFIRDRVFNPIGRFFKDTIPGWARSMKDKVVDFFAKMRDGLGRTWDGIKSKAKAPVNWVIRNVWNNGIVSIWKKITGWIGLGNKLKTLKELASGGTVGSGFGQPATPGVFNRPTAIVGEGNPAHPEFVIPTDPKYRGRARMLWEAAGAQLMEDGGVLGFLGGVAKKVGGAVVGGIKSIGDFLADPLGAAKKMLNSALGKLGDLGDHPFARMVARFPRMAVDGLIGLIKDAAGSLLGAIGLGGGGGSGVNRWKPVVQMALRQVGQPAAYTGITLRRMNQESGGNPKAVNRWDINWQRGHPSVGLMQVIRPTFQRYAGRYRKTGPFLYGVSINPLANIYSSMRYALASYGSLPRAYNRPGGYDDGGLLPPGLHSVYNGTRRPERVLTDRQWQALFAAARGGDGPRGDTYNFYPRTLDMTVADLDVLQRRQEARARMGRPR
ncbi:phage tail tape measure protein [Streptomyces sp. UG1]|uniref:phage tail tape measure protein n=1 Tax=Streptomyces sp. UG1 TaxID=3417652 RepID=UPI003CE6D0ED